MLPNELESPIKHLPNRERKRGDWLAEEKICPACAERVKAAAKVCKHCGYDFELRKPAAEAAKARKDQDNAKATGIGCLALLVLGGLLYTCSGESAADKEAREKKEAVDRTKGFHCLSAWDGSNRSMVEQVKAQLRDPDSFKHIETRITPVDKKGSHSVVMKFSSKNGFGGVNQGLATATVNDKSCAASDVDVADLSAIE